jgi:hypothetical protein
MRTRKVEFFGLGHPFVDALIDYLRGPHFRGEAASLPGSHGTEQLSVRFLVKVELEAGRHHVAYEHLLLDAAGAWEEAPARIDIKTLPSVRSAGAQTPTKMDEHLDLANVRARVAQGERELQARVRSNLDGVVSIRTIVVGVARLSAGADARQNEQRA